MNREDQLLNGLLDETIELNVLKYYPDGDYINMYIKKVDHYGDYVSGDVILFRSCETDEIIGVKLMNLTKTVEQAVKEQEEQDQLPSSEGPEEDFWGNFLKESKEYRSTHIYANYAYYSHHGDSYDIVVMGDGNTSESLRTGVTLHRDHKTKEVMGFKIHRVAHRMKKEES